ncbi:dienelactone hydrolase family protein [Dactylosporangium sp. CA-233914]|uniref:dienelactone hydrolase family protein n=1 Tax=Dactylosporangium sp. CA-233914 TaxID=3239934 RepID=UPI003D9123CB
MTTPRQPPVTRIDAAGALLDADVAVPQEARGLVVFVHGSGSSRLSPRNRLVAERLGGVGFATVLTDLLTPGEDADAAARFDIGLLTRRVVAVVDRVTGEPALCGLPLGLFGASTGAAAALRAAAQRPGQVRTVVSRGGRPDLAGDALERVTVPVLLIVGGLDHEVRALNEAAAGRLAGEHATWIVPGATHLFAEPGTLEEVAGAAAQWFDRCLAHGDLALDEYLREDDGDA